MTDFPFQFQSRRRLDKPSVSAFYLVLLNGLLLACGKTQATHSDDAETNSAGGGDATSGGASPSGSGGSTSTTGCVHPEVIEDCQGEYCRIEPGCFIMGAPEGEFGRALVDADQVQVTLTRPFWIGKTELTRAQWDSSGLPQPELKWLNGERECLEAQCPQGNLSPYLAFQYTNRLSEMEGLEPCYIIDLDACDGPLAEGYACPVKINAPSPYECEGYRLPMEAEWEYAARAGSTRAFPTGDITVQVDAGNCYFDAALDAVGWYCMNSMAQTQPVAQKPANAWGLHDVHGNAWEVVNDLYGASGYLSGPYVSAEGPLIDPTGAVNPPGDISRTLERQDRVTRGGSHIAGAFLANVSRRLSTVDHDTGSSIGLRVVRTIFED